MRIAILLESDRQIAAVEALVDALCRRGHAVHLAVQGDTVKDRDGALGRLAGAHLGLGVGLAPGRTGRFASLAKAALDRLEPLLEPETDEDDGEPAPGASPSGGAGLGRLVLAGLTPDPDIATYLRQLDLDLLLAAPRLDPWSARLDYLAACRRQGVPALLLADDAGQAPLASLLGPDAAVDAADLDAIERAGAAQARPRGASPLARTLLEAAASRRALRRFAEERLGADVRRGLLLGLIGRAGGSMQDLYARFVFPPLMAGLLALLPSRRALLRELLKEQLAGDEMSRLAFAEEAIEAARRGDAPIFFGPWTGGVGHELVYWIPMLRWLRKAYGIDKSKVVVISRGGVKTWYTGIIGHYLDVFDLAPLKRQQYREDALRRIASTEAPALAGKIEKEMLNEAARQIGAERYNSLHPQAMFKLFKRRWTGVAGDSFVDRYTRQQPIQAVSGAARKREIVIAGDYLALNFHFGAELKDAPEARAAIERFVQALARRIDVALIEPAIDAHLGPMAAIASGPRIHRLPAETRPSELLAIQSDLIAGSRALVGTLGPMSCLGQALGRPTLGVRDHDGPLSEGVRELMLGRPDPRTGPLHIVTLERLTALIPVLAGEEPDLAAALADAAAASAVGSAA